jgi:transcriptional regulator with XRE-family HTH domain
MAVLNVSNVIRQARQRMGISQEALSRHLNATKGAIQHWERGRNKPDVARLVTLRNLCPPGPERKRLEALIKSAGGEGTASATGEPAKPPRGGYALPDALENVSKLRKDNEKLQQRVEKLQKEVERRGEQLRILKDLAAQQQRELAALRAGGTASPASGAAPTE